MLRGLSWGGGRGTGASRGSPTTASPSHGAGGEGGDARVRPAQIRGRQAQRCKGIICAPRESLPRQEALLHHEAMNGLLALSRLQEHAPRLLRLFVNQLYPIHERVKLRFCFPARISGPAQAAPKVMMQDTIPNCAGQQCLL